MLDSPITLLLLGISAASALASYAAHRRRRATSRPPALSTLSDADLLAALASLDPQATNTRITAQRGAAHPAHHPKSVTHSPSEMREAHHPISGGLVEQDAEVHRRITLLVIEELERRGLPPASFR